VEQAGLFKLSVARTSLDVWVVSRVGSGVINHVLKTLRHSGRRSDGPEPVGRCPVLVPCASSLGWCDFRPAHREAIRPYRVPPAEAR
jgi:hypothetical protein